MDRTALISLISNKTELNVEVCEKLLDGFISVFRRKLTQRDIVSIPSFGNFEVRTRKERVISHPSNNGKKILIPPKSIINFKPSAILKNKINATENNG